MRACLLALVLLVFACFAQASAVIAPHPLEILALTEPEKVLATIAADKQRASADNNYLELARLNLAHANACRVGGDWNCQRKSANDAVENARTAKSTFLEIRGWILQARAQSALADYTSAQRSMSQADLLLQANPNAEQSADLWLAYSSYSRNLGKTDLAIDYARKGLAQLSPGVASAMRVRLLRNLAQNLTKIDKPEEALKALREAEVLVKTVADPKLQAEIWLEQGRAARANGDADTMQSTGIKIAEQSKKLSNSQLKGLAEEMFAGAALLRQQNSEAAGHFELAQAAFASLNLDRDELRVAREVLAIYTNSKDWQGASKGIARINELNDRIAKADRSEAADDFSERLEYTQQASRLALIEQKVKNESLQASVAQQRFRYGMVFTGLAALMALIFGGMYLRQRRLSKQLVVIDRQRLNAILTTSHDLRAPLNGILGLTKVLLEKPLNEEHKRMLRSIESAGHTLSTLSQDLLDSGRLEVGKLRLQLHHTDLHSLLESLMSLHRLRAQEKNLQLQLNIDSNVPKYVELDAARLQRVLDNLIGNALKFTTKGKVGLSVMCVDQATTTAWAKLQFTVTDTGPGISDDELGRLFMPFEKGLEGDKYGIGAGLGLSISQGFVNLMGGKLRVNSAVGAGSSFFFTIEAPVSDAPEKASIETISTPESQLKLRGLIVDDDKISAELHSYLLASLDCQTRVTHGVQEAINEAMLRDFDIALIDYELRDGKGLELVARLRALHEPGKILPYTVIISGHSPEHIADHATADAWIVKPINLARLREVVAIAALRSSTHKADQKH